MNETWGDVRAAWCAAFEALVAKFRPLYLAEVERFAETLRPRFESGELHGCTDDDLTAGDRLEALCREHFGIDVVDEERTGPTGRAYEVRVEQSPVTVMLILAASPSAEEASDPGQEIDSFNASYAASWDVLAIARARGWYTPAADESPDLESTRWALEARP